MNDKKFCMKCGKTLKIGEFYQSHNLEKYPDGYLDQCKKCITMHVDNFDQNTYLWLLQDCDVPYIPEEWNSLLVKFILLKSIYFFLTFIKISKRRNNEYNFW